MPGDSRVPAEGGTTELLPRRRADVEVRRDPTGAAHVLYDPSSGVRSVVNETALAIWQLCDGATRPHEMVRGAVELFGAPGDVVADDVHRALADLSAAGLVDWDRAPAGPDHAGPDHAGPDHAGPGRLADRERRS